MTVPAKSNITLKKGVTYRLQLNWKDATRRFVDLAGCTAKMQIRALPNPDSPVLLELNNAIVNGSGITLNNPKGRVEIVIQDELTAGLNFKTAFYDVLVTFTNGEVHCPIEGRVTLTPSATVI